MAQQVKIAGALFNDVPYIQCPDVNDVYHPFVDPSVTTAVAADVAQGKQFIAADGTVTQGTASGGGASNVVFGEFTAGEAGTAQSLSIDYSGSGYPVAICIYSNDGYNSSSAIAAAEHAYSVVCFSAVKSYPSVAPTYTGSGSNNQVYGAYLYKNRAVAGVNNTSGRLNGDSSFSNTDAISASNYFLRIKSKNSLSVFISSTSYGFLSGAKYKYVIVYSS